MNLTCSFVLALFFLAASSSLAQNYKDPWEIECEQNNAESCTNFAQMTRFNQPERTYQLTKKACELGSEDGCTQLYWDSLKLSTKEKDAAIRVIVTKCNQNAKFCMPLATFYGDNKAFDKQLLYSKKYFAVTGKGAYPLYEYNYGNKNTAFVAARKQCDVDKQSCAFYLRYMPDSPDVAFFIENVNYNCMHKDLNSSGATDCNILGAYDYKKGNKKSAYSLWNLGCQAGNLSACKLIIAADGPTEVFKRAAADTFCDRTFQTWASYEIAERKQLCPFNKSSRLPASFLKDAALLLKGYLEEQN